MDIRPIGPEEAETVARYANAVIIAALRRDPELPPPPNDPVLLLWVIRGLALHVTLRYEEIGGLAGMDQAAARAYGLRQTEGRNTDLDLMAMNDGQMPPPAPVTPGGCAAIEPSPSSSQSVADAYRLTLALLRHEPVILNPGGEPALQHLAGLAPAAASLYAGMLMSTPLSDGLSPDEAAGFAARFVEDELARLGPGGETL